MRTGHSGSSKVIDFRHSRKRESNFLLVININFGSILYRFGFKDENRHSNATKKHRQELLYNDDDDDDNSPAK